MPSVVHPHQGCVCHSPAWLGRWGRVVGLSTVSVQYPCPPDPAVEGALPGGPSDLGVAREHSSPLTASWTSPGGLSTRRAPGLDGGLKATGGPPCYGHSLGLSPLRCKDQRTGSGPGRQPWDPLPSGQAPCGQQEASGKLSGPSSWESSGEARLSWAPSRAWGRRAVLFEPQPCGRRSPSQGP